MTPSGNRDEIDAIRRQLTAIDAERQSLEHRLRGLEQPRIATAPAPQPAVAQEPAVTNASSATDKIALFRRLFGGRTDVFPARWDNPKTGRSGYAPACANEWVRGVCGKPQVKCGGCANKAFIPVTPDVIECHLRGEDRVRPNGRGKDFVAGVYPLFFDDTCGFLAVDFDEENWSSDALAFIASCSECQVPVALERSRSGNGGHVWLFFSEPVAGHSVGLIIPYRRVNQRRSRAMIDGGSCPCCSNCGSPGVKKELRLTGSESSPAHWRCFCCQA